jgi:hypothetical protein
LIKNGISIDITVKYDRMQTSMEYYLFHEDHFPHFNIVVRP